MYTKNFKHSEITRGLHYSNIDVAIGKYQVRKVFLRLSEIKNGGRNREVKGKVLSEHHDELGEARKCAVLQDIMRYSLVVRGVTSWSTLRSPNLSPLQTSHEWFRLTRSGGTRWYRPWLYPSMSLPIKHIWSSLLPPPPFPATRPVFCSAAEGSTGVPRRRRRDNRSRATLKHSAIRFIFHALWYRILERGWHVSALG
jgi:hypothetical protein